MFLKALLGPEPTFSISREFTPSFRNFQNLLTLLRAPRIAGERVAFRGLSSILLNFPHNARKLNTSKRRWSMPDIAERPASRRRRRGQHGRRLAPLDEQNDRDADDEQGRVNQPTFHITDQ